MITEFILNYIFLPVNSLLNLLPDVTISIPTDVVEGLKNIFSMLGFIFPIKRSTSNINNFYIYKDISYYMVFNYKN